MRTTKYYKVTASVAERSGVAEMRYRTADGMMILNEQDVRMIRLEPEEYLTGVVEAILTEDEAALLIEQGGKQLGLPHIVAGEGNDTLEGANEAAGEVDPENGPMTEETEGVTDEKPADNEENNVEPTEEEVEYE